MTPVVAWAPLSSGAAPSGGAFRAAHVASLPPGRRAARPGHRDGRLPRAPRRRSWSSRAGQVRPLALSPDGTRLFAVNTPDNRLEVFDVSAGGLTHLDSIPVGMEPVAVAARSNTQVWVVNHLSDSVSVVDLASTPPRVVRTLLVGDEPRDIVFAGTGEPQGLHHHGAPRPAPQRRLDHRRCRAAGDPQLTHSRSPARRRLGVRRRAISAPPSAERRRRS